MRSKIWEAEGKDGMNNLLALLCFDLLCLLVVPASPAPAPTPHVKSGVHLPSQAIDHLLWAGETRGSRPGLWDEGMTGSRCGLRGAAGPLRKRESH